MKSGRSVAVWVLRGGFPAALAVLLAGCFTSLDTTPVTSPGGTTTTLIIVRHAERDEGLDPPLNAEGVLRASALVGAVIENGVDEIYAPDLLRNQQTAEAVASALGLTIHKLSAAEIADTRAFANNFVHTITTQRAGKVVLFIGNTGPIVGTQSGNLQELYARLGGTGSPPTHYSDLFVAIIPEEGEGSVHWIRTSYGGESSLD